jgi:cell division protein FtsL
MAASSMSQWMEAWEQDLTPSDAARRSAGRLSARSQSTRYYGREATARLPKPFPEAEKAAAPSPRLKVLTRRRPQWLAISLSLVFAVLLLGGAVIGPVLLNSASASVEYKAAQLEKQQQQLTAAASSLKAEISSLSATGRLMTEADKLGLKPAPSVHYLQVGPGTTVAEGDTTVAGR